MAKKVYLKHKDSGVCRVIDALEFKHFKNIYQKNYIEISEKEYLDYLKGLKSKKRGRKPSNDSE